MNKDDVVSLKEDYRYNYFNLRKGSYGLVIDVEHKWNSSSYVVEFDITPMFSIEISDFDPKYLERVGTKSEILEGPNFEGYKGNL